jgi:hypothetical protein
MKHSELQARGWVLKSRQKHQTLLQRVLKNVIVCVGPKIICQEEQTGVKTRCFEAGLRFMPRTVSTYREA